LIPIIERQIKRTVIKPADAGYEGGMGVLNENAVKKNEKQVVIGKLRA